MPDPELVKLRKHLLRSGVSQRHVIRVVSELADHLEDLEAEALTGGMSRDLARAAASERLGELPDIARQMTDRPELKSWAYRHPAVARVVLPIVYFAALPAVPVYAGIERATAIVRWGACLLLSAAVTCLMLLAMQLSISPS